MKKEVRVFIIPCENGYYRFRLETVLKKIEKTKYSLAKQLNSEYKVINRYARGDLSRFNANVIAKICDFCNCRLDEIIQYIPNQKIKKANTLIIVLVFCRLCDDIFCNDLNYFYVKKWDLLVSSGGNFFMH